MFFIKKFTDYDEKLQKLKNHRLFQGLKLDEVREIIDNMTNILLFSKGEDIVTQNYEQDFIGIIISGSATIEKLDIEGKRLIVANIRECDTFGEALAFAKNSKSPVSVVANEKCEVLAINRKVITRLNNNIEKAYVTFLLNIMEETASKNYMLNQRIEILSKRSIRGKLLAYFGQNIKNESDNKSFVLPLSKTNLADYLCVERTSMLRVLKELQTEGVITIDKRVVTLIGGYDGQK